MNDRKIFLNHKLTKICKLSYLKTSNKRIFKLIYLIPLITANLPLSTFAIELKCKLAAEKIAIDLSKKRGNLANHLLSPANPTEMEGKYFIVYIGARANYNYFKLELDKSCKLIKVIEAEYP